MARRLLKTGQQQLANCLWLTGRFYARPRNGALFSGFDIKPASKVPGEGQVASMDAKPGGRIAFALAHGVFFYIHFDPGVA